MTTGARYTVWIILLVGAVLIQFLLGLFVDRKIGQFVTGAAMTLVVSIIYGSILCKCKNCNLQGNDSDDLGDDGDGGRSAPYIHISDNIDDNVQESTSCVETSDSISTRIDTSTLSVVNDDANEVIEVDSSPLQQLKKRLFYLDNLKIFLTFLVVSHHVTCAFGGCGPGGWILIVGLFDNSFQHFAGYFALLNQGYFMSLFFFISAYFVPSSYEKKGKKAFLYDKAKRYWLPAIFVTAIMAPLVILYGIWFVGGEPAYYPNAFHCWFLYWLLVLNLAYVHIRGTDECEEDSHEARQLPGPLKRLFVYGLGICGFGMLLVQIMLQDGTFCTMPLAPGSLVNDLLFFVAGTVARKHGWLEKKLTEQIGMPPFLLRIIVILEAALMCYFFSKGSEDNVYYIPAFLVAGVYCIDMSLVLLEFFQSYLDFQNRFTKYMSNAAYTVYIIHPVFVVGVTSIWIAYYESHGNVIEWTDLHSTTPIDGGGLTLMVGWIVSNVLSSVLVWPSASFLRKLPGLREIL
eukprot:CAMPEP_0204642828 /NCGR_PEP_ID=MMETSP0718-20130828/177_1 /ASSEMBLY_ACC=CAM_ASM_000674 /TAXON_ID=230516 /ORGANISM="Chaetoceros curvisetus" /LENGTH=515 /DNA_ID=CAMNT_0051663711 /DNA_START=35 /DNA_END=1582 /DNA_ORIENTATION=+